jgi:hypothetical protein
MFSTKIATGMVLDGKYICILVQAKIFYKDMMSAMVTMNRYLCPDVKSNSMEEYMNEEQQKKDTLLV